MNEQLLTVQQAAQRLGKTDRALRSAIYYDQHDPQTARRAPISVRVRGRRMFRVSDVDAFINAYFEQASS